MKKITEIKGQCIPLAMHDVDTDLIIPAQYLTAISKEGYGENLFRRLKEKDPQFVFNQPKYTGAKILIAGRNFGCGSSREHAVWALQQAGIEAVIAVSFADIFFSNSAKNGLLLITLAEEIIQEMLEKAAAASYCLQIQLPEQQIQAEDGETFAFAVDSFRKYCFLQGLDDLDYLLSHREIINNYENDQLNKRFLPNVGN